MQIFKKECVGCGPGCRVMRSQCNLHLKEPRYQPQSHKNWNNMSHVMRKPAFCMCKNKAADQLRSNCTADQRLCFRNKDSTIPLLPKSEIQPSVAVQPGLCGPRSKNPEDRFSHNEAHMYRHTKVRRSKSWSLYGNQSESCMLGIACIPI